MTEHLSLEDLALDHAQKLVDYAYLVCRDRDLALDAVQSVFTRLAASQAPLAGIENPVGYLRRAVTNELLSTRRRRGRLRALLPRMIDDRPGDDPAEALVAKWELWEAFDVLNSRQRAAVVLRYYCDLDDEEIASVLQCAPATVRSILSRAIRRLRSRLEGTRRAR